MHATRRVNRPPGAHSYQISEATRTVAPGRNVEPSIPWLDHPKNHGTATYHAQPVSDRRANAKLHPVHSRA